MKILSVHALEESLENHFVSKLSGVMDPGGLDIRIERGGDKPVILRVRFAGAVLSLVDAESTSTNRFAGAVAGQLLLGPVGALAGAGMGGSKRTFTMVLKSPDARVVFEATKPELQRLIGFGMASTGEVPIERKTLPKGERDRSGLMALALLALIVTFVMCARSSRRDETSAQTAQPPTEASVAVAETVVAAPPHPKVAPKPKAKPKVASKAAALPKAGPASAPVPVPERAKLAASAPAQPFRPSTSDLTPSPY